MKKLTYGWVFNPEEESLVLGEEKAEGMMLRSAKHVRDCCLAGHSCRNGSRCQDRCASCHEERMAAWDGKRYELTRQADAFLASRDGIPLSVAKEIPIPSVEAVVEAVIEELIKAGITF